MLALAGVLLLSLSVSVRADTVTCGKSLYGCSDSSLWINDQTTISADGNDIECVGHLGCYQFGIHSANSLNCGDFGVCAEAMISNDPTMTYASSVFTVTCSGDYSCHTADITANYPTVVTCYGVNSCVGAEIKAAEGQSLEVDFTSGNEQEDEIKIICFWSGSTCTIRCAGGSCFRVVVIVTAATKDQLTMMCEDAACPMVFLYDPETGDFTTVSSARNGPIQKLLGQTGRTAGSEQVVQISMIWVYGVCAMLLVLLTVNVTCLLMQRRTRKYDPVNYGSEDA